MALTLDEFFASRDWDVIERATGWTIVRDKENPCVVRQHVTAKDGRLCIAAGVAIDAYGREVPDREGWLDRFADAVGRFWDANA